MNIETAPSHMSLACESSSSMENSNPIVNSSSHIVNPNIVNRYIELDKT
jgi:hypothetical protein